MADPLEELRDQAAGSPGSLAAKQALINGLNAEIAELRRQLDEWRQNAVDAILAQGKILAEKDAAEARVRELEDALNMATQGRYSALMLELAGKQAKQTADALENIELRERVKENEAALAEAQAKIDALMLEYCPDEMTAEQIEEWGKHQKPASAEQHRQIEAARKGK